ncbi:hypothetical protein [Actinospica sp.]|jgi:hypothetical protein|uniref:hypothetical protein n=1 Tax=Actinospica sp. TaxID=1872142 RepID=UPI002B9DDEFD|nr:hypothetical protein [Actinospica sp.]HWG23984.1 hypothetical protein [Actinospica sp.]
MKMSSWINFDALWKIIVVGVALGAGLPALFAVGLRALSIGGTATVAVEPGAGTRPGAAAAGGNLTGRVIAVLCFAIVLAGIGWGVYKIVHPN